MKHVRVSYTKPSFGDVRWNNDLQNIESIRQINNSKRVGAKNQQNSI